MTSIREEMWKTKGILFNFAITDLKIRYKNSVPDALGQRVLGEFVKCLTEEFIAGPAAADLVLGLAALDLHRGDAADALHFVGRSEPLAVTTECRQQPRGQRVASAGKGLKDLRVGMMFHQVRQLTIELFERFNQRQQLGDV